MEQDFVKYPIGIQNFEKIRRGDYAYVDKTEQVWQLARSSGYYFLGRPRRFGKSLLLSTLEAYFEGKRELFEGLKIMQMEQEWKQYPVLHLDLNAKQYNSREALVKILNMHLERWEQRYGDKFRDRDPEERFAHVIEQACEQTQMPVVILVDEYDKPLSLNIEDEALQDEFRGILKAFYGVMKSADRYIKLGFLTGVTKFSKVSVFSDLNNIRDISMLPQYVTACGMTEQEIRDNFDGEVAKLAEATRMTQDECYAELRRRYDGYHFCEDSPGMYNPYSVINTLASQRFSDYWFETGTPTRLISMLRSTEFNLYDLVEGEVSSQLLNSVDSMKTSPVTIFYQSGYLTIKGYDPEFQEYRLGFPNKEVENGFINCLLPLYTNMKTNPTQFSASRFVREIQGGQPEAFMTRLEAMMADTDYRIVGKAELYFQNFLFTFFRLLGLYVEVERATSDGRTDMVVQTPGYVYIFEFKLDQSADAALEQIEQKGYARPFAADPRPLYKIGVSFSTAQRRVTDWKVTQ
ncbi:MAG: ATP-binding protein [Prevotella sp.]|nr:ATP-binding protein [Prevotella sp.]